MNLNEEVRCGYTVSARMKQVWEIPDIIHADFEDCQKHGMDVGK